MCLSIAAVTNNFAVMCSDSYAYIPSTDKGEYSSQRMLSTGKVAWSFVGNEEFMTNDFWKLLLENVSCDVVADRVSKYLYYRGGEIQDLHANQDKAEMEEEGYFNFCLLGVGQINKFPYVMEINSFKGFNPCYYSCLGSTSVELLVAVPGEFYGGEEKRNAFINLKQQIEAYYNKHKQPNVDDYGLLIDAISRGMYYFSDIQETLWGGKYSGGIITSVVLKQVKLPTGGATENFVLSCPSKCKDFAEFQFVNLKGGNKGGNV